MTGRRPKFDVIEEMPEGKKDHELNVDESAE
jgi:hypothetical protein